MRRKYNNQEKLCAFCHSRSHVEKNRPVKTVNKREGTVFYYNNYSQILLPIVRPCGRKICQNCVNLNERKWKDLHENYSKQKMEDEEEDEKECSCSFKNHVHPTPVEYKERGLIEDNNCPCFDSFQDNKLSIIQTSRLIKLIGMLIDKNTRKCPQCSKEFNENL